jgi:flagellin
MLFENNKAASTPMERLATGFRINKAQDDVAGSAIADRMTSQVRGLNMAVKNVNDAMAMLSVADSAASDITNMLQRMRELAIQAASDTNSAADRQYLQDEVDSLIQEIDRVATQTHYNGQNLLDGSKSASFQVGASSGQTVGFDFQSLQFNSGSQASGNENITLVDTGNSAESSFVTQLDNTYNNAKTEIIDSNYNAGTIQNLVIGDKVAFESNTSRHWTVVSNGYQNNGIEAGFYIAGDAGEFGGRIFKVTPNTSDSSQNSQESSASAVQRDISISAQGPERSEYPRSIQLSADGNILVAGTPYFHYEGGYVAVYKWADQTWQQLGTNITQEGWFERWGNAWPLMARAVE